VDSCFSFSRAYRQKPRNCFDNNDAVQGNLPFSQSNLQQDWEVQQHRIVWHTQTSTHQSSFAVAEESCMNSQCTVWISAGEVSVQFANSKTAHETNFAHLLNKLQFGSERLLLGMQRSQCLQQLLVTSLGFLHNKTQYRPFGMENVAPITCNSSNVECNRDSTCCVWWNCSLIFA
jgi:hypothetical protein